MKDGKTNAMSKPKSEPPAADLPTSEAAQATESAQETVSAGSNPESGPIGKLSPDQIKAVGLLLEGLSAGWVAQRVGVDWTTVQRWKKLPDFAAALEQGKRDLYDEFRSRRELMVEAAYDALLFATRAYHTSVSVAASKVILAMNGLDKPEPRTSLNGASLPGNGTTRGNTGDPARRPPISETINRSNQDLHPEDAAVKLPA